MEKADSDLSKARPAQPSTGCAALPALIRAAALEEIIPLRHEVLRAGLPREAACIEGDNDLTTRHYGAFINDGRNVACATLVQDRWQDEPAWLLRGMAVAPDLQRTGLGRAILVFVEEDAKKHHPLRLMWCNSRIPAIRFYQRLGWQLTSGALEIPTDGPDVPMVKRL